MKIKLSVIIPCYNHGKYIKQAVESVLSYVDQSLLEIIVVNDGSNDGSTYEIVNSLNASNLRIINQENQGLAKSRNNGIALAKGEYILPLDSDNFIHPDFIEDAIKILSQNADVGIVYSDRMIFKNADIQNAKLVKSNKIEMKFLLMGQTIDACAFYRKSVWQILNGYDQNMPVMGLEDWDFWIRALDANVVFHHLPKGLFYYRDLSDSMMKSANNKQELVLKYVIQKHSAIYAKYIFQIGKELSYANRKPFRFAFKTLLTKLNQIF